MKTQDLFIFCEKSFGGFGHGRSRQSEKLKAMLRPAEMRYFKYPLKAFNATNVGSNLATVPSPWHLLFLSGISKTSCVLLSRVNFLKHINFILGYFQAMHLAKWRKAPIQFIVRLTE
jgi:hypothetical protein